MRIEDDYTEDEFPDEESFPDAHYIVMWCSEGLECVIPLDITKLNDGAEMLAVLEDRENEYGKEISRLLYMLKIRAQANSQRSYEIYKLTTSGSIGQKEIEQMFETSPQTAADLIRVKGVRIYGEGVGKRTQVII